MDDSSPETVLIFVLVIILALAVAWPKIKNAQEERAKRQAEQRERLAAERVRLETERQNLLIKVRSSAPGFILQAQRDFRKDYQSKGSSGFFAHEISPLVCFGYRVGKTNGRTEPERHDILVYAVCADLDETLPYLPANYRAEWGRPLSSTRLNRILSHLNSMAELHSSKPSHRVAVAHWQADATWLLSNQKPLVERYSAI